MRQGRPFQKGMKKIGGRKTGTLNKRTAQIRWAIAECARGLGGVERLIAWREESPENEFAFWTQLYPKLLPVHIEATNEVILRAERDAERQDLLRQLAERGLPSALFGNDKPVLELEAPRIEGRPFT